MKTLLIQGFGDAFHGLGAALRLFWPILACIVAMWLFGFLLGYSGVMADGWGAAILLLLLSLCSLIYVFFALCQGAVGWHRRLILGETTGWISPLPRRRAFQYALAVFLFGLAVVVLYFIIGFVFLPFIQSEFLATLPNIDTSTAPVDQLEAWQKAMRPLQITLFAIVIGIFWLVLQGAESWLLIYPHISVREGQSAYAKIRTILPTPNGLTGALLMSYFLPSVLSLIYGLLVPIRVQLLPWVSVTVIIFEYVLFAFCFLAGLSILSRAYATATKGRVFQQEAGAAPA